MNPASQRERQKARNADDDDNENKKKQRKILKAKSFERNWRKQNSRTISEINWIMSSNICHSNLSNVHKSAACSEISIKPVTFH